MRRLVWMATIAMTALLSMGARQSDFAKKVFSLPEGGSAKDPKTGLEVTVHKKNAGTKDAQGWYTARETECGFRVQLPAPYNDITQKGPTTDDRTFMIHTIGGHTPAGLKFSATCMERSDHTIPADFLATAFKNFAPPDIQKSGTVAAGGLTWQFVQVSKGQNRLAERVVQIGSRVYELSVEYPAAETLPPEATHFFDSFAAK